MDLHLSGLNVLVTGGSAGIGAAIVQEFLNEGCNVAFCSRSQQNIDNFLAQIDKNQQSHVQAKALNVTDTAGFATWLTELKQIDIFIPNVSALSFADTYQPNETTLSANWAKVIEIDLMATICLIDLIVPYLRQSKHPALTYISSIATSRATINMPTYGAIKAALNHYMKTLSKKLINHKIRVNTISPGDVYVPGGFWDTIRSERPQAYQATLDRNPMQRLGQPGEIAKVVAFISSPVASFVAGANWLVDGNSTNHVQT